MNLINPYQHVFITDYSLIIIDSRMANRAVRNVHSLIKNMFVFFFRLFILIMNYYEHQHLLLKLNPMINI
jgi:hypothetical protein